MAVNTNSEHIEGVRWFLALSLLKKGEKQQAKQTLKELIDSSQTYQRQNAKNILNALD